MKYRFLFVFFFLVHCNYLEISKDTVNDFSLLDTSDNQIDFFKIMNQKKLSIIFFGYSHCPNVCYSTLNKFNKIVNNIDKSTKDKIEFIFISIDPVLDDKIKLLAMKKNTDSSVLFLRGDKSNIEKIKNNFGVKVFEANDNNKSSLIHSTTIFVVDNNHKIINKIPSEVDTEMILKFLNHYFLELN